MFERLVKSFRRRSIGGLSIGLTRGATAFAVLILALWLGALWQERRQVTEGARQAQELAAGAEAQSRRMEALYSRPAHESRPARSSALRQLAVIVSELGLDRRADIHPEARWAVARLYGAARQSAAAAHFADQLWAAGDRSERLAAIRAVAHGRTGMARLSAPRGPGAPGEPYDSFPKGPFVDSLAAVVESLGALAPADAGPLEVTAGEDSRAVAGDAAARWLTAFREEDAPAAARALTDIVDTLPGLADPLEQYGVASSWLAGSLRLIRARLQWPSRPDEARRSWAEAIEDLNAAQRSFPSDPDVYVGLCAAWSDLLAVEFEPNRADRPAAEGAGRPVTHRAPRFSQAAVSCQDGLRLSPDSQALMLGLSRVDLLHAQWRLEQGLDARPWIADAQRLNDQLLGSDPQQSTAQRDRELLESLIRRSEAAGPTAALE